MSHRPSSLYQSTSLLPTHHTASVQLQARIASKRAELANLRELRDLSAQLASQMALLEQKLSTLRDGTEAVAEVMKNWGSVMGVLGMVGQNVERLERDGKEENVELPGTLVRVPVGVDVVGQDKATDDGEG